MKQKYAIFGLGNYGMAIAKKLLRSGIEVIAVDMNEEIVNDAAKELPICKCADVTEVEALKKLGIADIDVVIISMARSLESSVMTVTLCKELGVKTVIAKCHNKLHKKILSKVGADKVVFPEMEAGVRLAKSLINSGFTDAVELSDDFTIVSISVKDEWVNKTLMELDLRKKYKVNVIAIKTDDEMSINVDPNMKLEQGQELVVVTSVDQIEKLNKL